MRPIDQDNLGGDYSAEAALEGRVQLFSAASDEEGGDGPRLVQSTVRAEAEKLEALIVSGYDPGNVWGLKTDKAEASRLTARIGKGWQAATGDLIERSGAYCAYCEIAQPTGLLADPVKPASWFPREAFDPANLLLACPACRASKLKRLSRRSGQLSGPAGPVAPLWPHTYWKGLASPSRLPFRHRLYEGGGGGGADRREVSYERALQWVAAYRQGLIGVDVAKPTAKARSPRLGLRPPAHGSSGAALHLAAWVEADDKASPDGAARATIDILDLNCQAGDRDDRRQELRTRAFLVALDLWERIDSTARVNGLDEQLRAGPQWMLDLCIKATGCWGVWIAVFGTAPDFLRRLAGLLPGTVATPLWEI